MTVLDCVDEGPVLSPELARPKNITKAQIQHCISKLSSHWDDEYLELFFQCSEKIFIHILIEQGCKPDQLR